MSNRATPDGWDAFGREFGLRLQRLRTTLAMTQEQVAYTAGLTRSYYQQLERGESGLGRPANPSLLVIVSLAGVLGVAPAELIPDLPDSRTTDTVSSSRGTPPTRRPAV